VRTPRVRDAADAKAIVECLLFAAVEPLTVGQIREIVRPMKEKDLRALLVELQNEYDSRGGGLQIVEVAGGYQMATRGRYADWLAPFQKRKRRTGLSVAMLETLAIIAYKQPIIRAEVDAIRGVDSSGVIHALQEIELIETVGQKQAPGRPYLYGTTKDFLKHFGLKSLSELPSIESLRERFDLSQG
jgi:segregation and condensation protein B